MILPRFTIRFLLILIGVFGLLSVMFAMAAQGSPWALAASLTLAFVPFAFAVYAAVFGLALLMSICVEACRSQPEEASPFAPPQRDQAASP